MSDSSARETLRTGRYRQLRGPALWIWQTLLCAIPLAGITFILGIHIKLGLLLFTEQYIGFFLGLVLAGCFIGVPSRDASIERVPWYDWLGAGLSLTVGFYIAVNYPQISQLMAYVTTERVVLGVAAVLLVLEALRRLTGWILVVVVVLFLGYALGASQMPGPLNGRSIELHNLADYLYLDPNSMLRMVALAATLALAFILYGQVLMALGGSDLLNTLAVGLFGTLRGTGRLLIEVTVVLAAAGLIVGVTWITGLGFNAAMALTQVGEHSLFLLLLVSAVVCIVLGMGMPSVAAYALVAVLVAPAMEQMGILPLAAHLFIFYFAVLSNFTPPIALACFAAAPIAGASPHRIGWIAVRLGIVAYVVPFLFVYSPTLIMSGDLLPIVVSVLTAVIGSIVLAVAVEGFLFRTLGALKRLLLTACALGLLLPFGETGGLLGWTAMANVFGAAAIVFVALTEWKARNGTLDPQKVGVGTLSR